MLNVGFSELALRDRGGRRSGEVRRRSPFPGFMPERRSGLDRRNSSDRRTTEDPRELFLQRNTDHYMEFASAGKGLFLALAISLPIWGLIAFFIAK